LQIAIFFLANDKEIKDIAEQSNLDTGETSAMLKDAFSNVKPDRYKIELSSDKRKVIIM